MGTQFLSTLMISKEHVMNMQSGGEFQWIDSLTSVLITVVNLLIS